FLALFRRPPTSSLFPYTTLFRSAQHVLGCACGEPFASDELYAEVITAAPYAQLSRADFDDVVDFVASGGYALKTYERFARIKQEDRKSTRLNSSHVKISYAVFCL